MSRKRYPEKFKIEAVKQVTEAGYSADDVAERLETTTNSLYSWTPIHSEQIPEFLTYIDVTYAGTLKSSLYKYGASLTKINDYMAAAKPIIYAVGDPGNAIETSGCGVSCEAENVKAMDTLSAVSNFDLSGMGKKGYDWLYQYQTVDQQMRRVLEKLNEH